MGMRRANNQDSHASIPAKNADRFWQRGHLFVVADGMGAHAAGELASRIATEQIALNYFRAHHEDSIEALRVAVQESNSEIYQRGQKNPEFHNMGTTASALAVVPQGAIIAHVGDSRIYRLRAGVFEQLTFDHSLVWEMEASGQVDPDSELGQSIPRNVITRSLGPSPTVTVDVEGPLEIQVGDRFLLCSDGLSGQVEDVEIGTLVDCLPEDLATQVLIDLANLRGGPDNTTVIIVRVEEGPEVNPGPPRPMPEKKRTEKKSPSVPMPLILATVACFAVAILLGALALSGTSSAWGPLVIVLVLGLIAAGFCGAQYQKIKQLQSEKPLPKVSGGKAPYRRYNAAPTKILYDKLGSTVKELRQAADRNNWMMEWHGIDELQQKGADALKSKQPKQAIRHQAEAIIETMNQLREQHNRAANETAIDY
ncbi:MAG: serine/threonine-protein phosphatase [Pirellulaceae bacterium]|nr:serine/threonine-protein phosphatase [Pirellulaceae bacterium]